MRVQDTGAVLGAVERHSLDEADEDFHLRRPMLLAHAFLAPSAP